MAESRLELVISSRQAERDLNRLEGRLHGVDRAGDQAGRSMQGLSGSISSVRTVAMAAGGLFAAMGLNSFSRDVFNTVASVEKMRASLATVTGSIEGANAAWEQMREFAKTTPFELEQSVQGFIRMKSLGLDPTEESMRSFANTASAMGTDLTQMIEAVADASAKEFERLREYGITASQNGDRVALTFQGITTEIGNNAREIQQYLENIGNTTFADNAINQVDTLGGRLNNLSDSVTDLYILIGEAGATDLFNSALDGAASAVDFLSNNVDNLAKGVDMLGDAAIIAAGIYTGRFVAAMADGTASLVSKTAASVADARAEAAAAQAVTRRTGAEALAAKRLLGRAAAEARATQGTAAHTAALARLNTQRQLAVQASAAHTAATNTATAAMGRASVAASAMGAASRGAAGAMALMGGPLGLLVGAAGLLYVFRDELNLTGRRAGLTEDQISDLRDEMKDMSQDDLSGSLSSLNAELDAATIKAATAREELAKLRSENRGSGALGFGGGEIGAEVSGMQAVAEAQERILELDQKIAVAKGETASRIEQNANAYVVYANRVEEETRLAEEFNKTLSSSLEDTADKTATLADSYEDLLDRITPNRRETQQYARDLGVLNLALASGRMTTQQYMQAMGMLQESFQAAQRDTTDLADTVDTESDRMATLWERQLERMDDAGVDMWRSFLDGSEDAFSSFKNLALNTLAEVIHQYTTRQITASLGFTAGGQGGQMSMGGGGGMPSFSGMMNGSGVIANAWRAFQGTGSTYAGTFGSELVATGQGGIGAASSSLTNSAAGGLYTAGAGYIGGYAGTELGGAIFGKEANSAYGATAGAMIGSIWGPLGSAVGGAIGGALDSLFGSGEKNPEFIYQQDNRAPEEYDFGGRESAFGSFGFAQQDLGEEGREALDNFSTALQQADNALSQFMDGDQVSAATAALQEFEYAGLSNADLLADRLDTLLNAAGMQGELYDRMRDDYQGDDAAGRYEAALNIAALESVLEQVPENVIAHVEDRLEASDQVIGELTQSLSIQIAQWEQLGGTLEQFVPTFDRLADGAVDVTNALHDAAGGMENLNALHSSYYSNFFTEGERQRQLQQQLTEQFAALNMTLPESRSEFRSLVEGLDLTTGAGRDAYLSMLNLSGSFAQLTSDAAAAGNEISQAAKSLYSGGAMGEIESALAAFNGTSNTISDIAETREQQLEDERRAITSLGDLIDSLSVSNLAAGSTLNAARSQYQSLYRQAQGGDAEAAQGLSDAARTYLEQEQANASTAQEYARVYAQVTNGVSGLEEQFGASVRQMGDVERIGERQLREQEKARQTLIDQLQTQIDMLDGIHTFSGLLDTLPASIASQLEGAIASEGKYGDVLPDGTYTSDSGFSGTQRTINDLYKGVLGRNADESGLDYWTGELASGRMSLSEIRDRMEDQAAHGYHANGISDVPFDGYRAVLHKGEDVLPAPIAKMYREGAPNSNAELVAEVKALRQELAASQRAIAENTRKTARLAERDELRKRQEEFA